MYVTHTLTGPNPQQTRKLLQYYFKVLKVFTIFFNLCLAPDPEECFSLNVMAHILTHTQKNSEC